jgi:hypothetical protein
MFELLLLCYAKCLMIPVEFLFSLLSFDLLDCKTFSLLEKTPRLSSSQGRSQCWESRKTLISNCKLPIKILPERWNLINPFCSCLFISSRIQVNWDQHKQLEKNILRPNAQMSNILPSPKPIKSHTRCWGCTHTKFNILSSLSFHQPDAAVDSSFHNYLSHKETFADLKWQPPSATLARMLKRWLFCSCPKTCYWFSQPHRTIHHGSGPNEGLWGAHVHFITTVLRSEHFSPLWL